MPGDRQVRPTREGQLADGDPLGGRRPDAEAGDRSRPRQVDERAVRWGRRPAGTATPGRSRRTPSRYSRWGSPRPPTPVEGIAKLGTSKLGISKLGIAKLGTSNDGLFSKLGMTKLGRLGMAKDGMTMLRIETEAWGCLHPRRHPARSWVARHRPRVPSARRPGRSWGPVVTVTQATARTRMTANARRLRPTRASMRIRHHSARDTSRMDEKARLPGGYTTAPAPTMRPWMHTGRSGTRSDAGLDRVDVVVPLRTLAGGKARLGGALDAEEREELVLGMLRRTLRCSRPGRRRARPRREPDPRVLRVAARPARDAVRQDGRGPQRRASRLGIEAAAEAGARRGPDPARPTCPCLTRTSLDRLLDAADAALAAGRRPAARGHRAVRRAQRHQRAAAVPAGRHRAELRRAPASRRTSGRPRQPDATLQVGRRPGLGFDLDTPEDLELLPAASCRDLLRLGRGRPRRP